MVCFLLSPPRSPRAPVTWKPAPRWSKERLWRLRPRRRRLLLKGPGPAQPGDVLGRGVPPLVRRSIRLGPRPLRATAAPHGSLGGRALGAARARLRVDRRSLALNGASLGRAGAADDHARAARPHQLLAFTKRHHRNALGLLGLAPVREDRRCVGLLAGAGEGRGLRGRTRLTDAGGRSSSRGATPVDVSSNSLGMVMSNGSRRPAAVASGSCASLRAEPATETLPALRWAVRSTRSERCRPFAFVGALFGRAASASMASWIFSSVAPPMAVITSRTNLYAKSRTSSRPEALPRVSAARSNMPSKGPISGRSSTPGRSSWPF